MTTLNLTKGSLPAVIRNDEGLYEGDLIHYFKAVFNHATNLFNPYHNFRHMFHVLWLCHEACKFYRDRLSPRPMRILLIAALFHDFDHSGKAGNDDLNIERSVRGLETYITEADRPLIEEIAKLIKATQYPYVVEADTLELSGLILRDADVSQCLSVAWIQQCVFGFAEEWNVTPCEVLRRQKPFLDSVRFHTSWAQNQFSHVDIKAKIQEAMEILDLLGVSQNGFACT
jgi:hypothetical protein